MGATEYFFCHTPYRKMPADLTPAQMLLNSRDGRPGHLLAHRPLTVSGAPARDYVHEEDGWILATRAIHASDTLYQLIVVGRAGVQTAPDTSLLRVLQPGAAPGSLIPQLSPLSTEPSSVL